MKSKHRTASLVNANVHHFPRWVGSRRTRSAGSRAGILEAIRENLERVSSSASSEALKSALSSPTDVGGVATLLSILLLLVSICPRWIRS